jgi:Holliday junction resolvase
MGGRRSRDKGNRTERGVVQLLTALGLRAARVPLSGSAGGAFSADVEVYLPGSESPAQLEVKCRANGFRTLYQWLEGVDALILKADHKPRLLVVNLDEIAGD